MPSRIDPLAITAFTATSALGRGRAAHAQALLSKRGGLRVNDFTPAPLTCAIGRVDDLETTPLPDDAAREAIERYGAGRVALLLGTSTGSIGATEEAYTDLEGGTFPVGLCNPLLHTPHSLGVFLEAALGTRGPCITIATACSSSAKIFAQAERLLRAGVADAAILGGVDTLCGSVLFGFNALELVAPDPCRPFDVARRGISIGEAAGFALLERDGLASAPRLLGYGEASDAHHMSTPHPQGLGARLALGDALARAGLATIDIDYINLHGTATIKNDEVEAALVRDLFPATTRASSTKGYTGHTLGAAGILESVITLLAMEQGVVPGTLNSTTLDPLCGPQITLDNESRTIRVALSNSFGFGGNNCTLAFGCGRSA